MSPDHPSDDPMAAAHAETGAAWDVVARAKYAEEADEHLALLRSGADNLLPPERVLLSGLLEAADVVQLQCSHGLDALGLLNAGARSVVGLDISGEMVAQARAKTEALGLGEDRARFLRSDAAHVPAELHGTADLVYTGRGSLPWILDLAPWARSIRGLLRPGGRFFVFEGHPLTFVWDRDADAPVLRPGAAYFDDTPAENEGFPRSVVERAADGGAAPRMLERSWRPSQVIDALAREGLALERFEEYPDLFWDQFPAWPEAVRQALPNSYAVLARAP